MMIRIYTAYIQLIKACFKVAPRRKINKNKNKIKRPYGIKSIRVDVNLKKKKIDGYNKIIHAWHNKKKVYPYRGI